LRPGQQFRAVAVQDGDHFIVLYVPKPMPDMAFPKEPEVSKQLAERDVRRKRPYLGKYC
jgi:hypothetical protein